MPTLKYQYNGISAAQGNAYIAFLEANSATFRSAEQQVADIGITTVVFNFGSNTTHLFGSNDSSGSPTYNPSESYQSVTQPNVYNIQINTAALGAYPTTVNGQTIYFVEPIEILMARELAHATGFSDVNPFTGKTQLGAPETSVIPLQNQISQEINNSTGSRLPINAVANRAAVGNADLSIAAGTTENGSAKSVWSLSTATSLGPGTPLPNFSLPSGAVHFQAGNTNFAIDSTNILDSTWQQTGALPLREAFLMQTVTS